LATNASTSFGQPEKNASLTQNATSLQQEDNKTAFAAPKNTSLTEPVADKPSSALTLKLAKQEAKLKAT